MSGFIRTPSNPNRGTRRVGIVLSRSYVFLHVKFVRKTHPKCDGPYTNIFNAVYYYIVDSPRNEGKDFFEISMQTGEIFTKVVFDREKQGAYALEVEARDGAPSARPNSDNQPNSGQAKSIPFDHGRPIIHQLLLHVCANINLCDRFDCDYLDRAGPQPEAVIRLSRSFPYLSHERDGGAPPLPMQPPLSDTTRRRRRIGDDEFV
ncbi:Neural-cadherin [Eumeta japonica]|uniref:Neural-cadherin n=1 Tax=Eumeta variegata TaxID=151549 RepID=A0A4C1WRP1_EUMVA|nr:Neural-cadherin [Eumeta japonica]